jgi:hypothetical protein
LEPCRLIVDRRAGGILGRYAGIRTHVSRRQASRPRMGEGTQQSATGNGCRAAVAAPGRIPPRAGTSLRCLSRGAANSERRWSTSYQSTATTKLTPPSASHRPPAANPAAPPPPTAAHRLPPGGFVPGLVPKRSSGAVAARCIVRHTIAASSADSQTASLRDLQAASTVSLADSTRLATCGRTLIPPPAMKGSHGSHRPHAAPPWEGRSAGRRSAWDDCGKGRPPLADPGPSPGRWR